MNIYALASLIYFVMAYINYRDTYEYLEVDADTDKVTTSVYKLYYSYLYAGLGLIYLYKGIK